MCGKAEASSGGRSRRARLSPDVSEVEDTLFSSLGDDLALEVLHRLPAKSLFRFKFVSRRWRAFISDPCRCRSLISNPSFPDRHRRRHDASTACAGFLYQLCYSNPSFPGVAQLSFLPESMHIGDPLAADLQMSLCHLEINGHRVSVVDSDRGLLLCLDNQPEQGRLFVGNPLTKKWLAVRNPPFRVYPKLVCGEDGGFLLVSPPMPVLGQMWVLIFCSNTGKWKEAGHDLATQEFEFAPGRPVLLENNIYWPSSRGGRRGFAYDIGEGKLWVVDFPGDSASCGKNCLSVSGGKLYYAECDRHVLRLWACNGGSSTRTIWWHKHMVGISEMFLELPDLYYKIQTDMSRELASVFPLGLHHLDPDLIYLRFPKIIVLIDLQRARLEEMYADDASLDDHFLRSCIIPIALPVRPTAIPVLKFRM